MSIGRFSDVVWYDSIKHWCREHSYINFLTISRLVKKRKRTPSVTAKIDMNLKLEGGCSYLFKRGDFGNFQIGSIAVKCSKFGDFPIFKKIPFFWCPHT